MFFVTESVYVSVAHRYHQPRWSLERNREVYGADHSIEGLGHNLQVAVTVASSQFVASPIFPRSWLEPVLKKLALELDHKDLPVEIEVFREQASTLENITEFLWHKLTDRAPLEGQWHSLRVQEGQHLACQRWHTGEMRLTFQTRLPGLWHNAEGRLTGGEWDVEIELMGALDATTGLLIQRALLVRLVNNALAPFHNQNWSEVFASDDRGQWSEALFQALEKSFASEGLRLGSARFTAKPGEVYGIQSNSRLSLGHERR